MSKQKCPDREHWKFDVNPLEWINVACVLAGCLGIHGESWYTGSVKVQYLVRLCTWRRTELVRCCVQSSFEAESRAEPGVVSQGAKRGIYHQLHRGGYLQYNSPAEPNEPWSVLHGAPALLHGINALVRGWRIYSKLWLTNRNWHVEKCYRYYSVGNREKL